MSAYDIITNTTLVALLIGIMIGCYITVSLSHRNKRNRTIGRMLSGDK